jgi:hypothetical protein
MKEKLLLSIVIINTIAFACDFAGPQFKRLSTHRKMLDSRKVGFITYVNICDEYSSVPHGLHYHFEYQKVYLSYILLV